MAMAHDHSRFQEALYYGLRCFIVVVILLSLSLISGGQEVDPMIDPIEVEAVYRILEGINYEINWRTNFPGNPCTGGPHGINCEIYNNTWHVVELNLGWVSDYVNNPPCTENATIDPAIFQFTHLKKLFFYKCFTKLHTRIPSEIWKLASLKHLAFQSNSALVGEIPSEIGNLSNLERLVLYQNSLQGFIPEEIGNLKNLQQLLLSHNQLTGLIPHTIQALGSLKVLDLSGNKLTGEIPSTLGSLHALQKIDLSDNLHCGYIPNELGNLERLQFLDLSSNELNGSIPHSLSKLVCLQYLFLGDNPLGGSLPDFWSNLSNLIGLKLSRSQYEGCIPESLGLLLHLKSLSLDNNRLVGMIPPSLGELPSVCHMNLSSNFLTGPVVFPLSFICRLGHNLHVRNNPGLCYESSLRGVISMDLDQCIGNTSSTISTIDGSSSALADSSYSSSKRPAKAIALLCFVASVYLSML